MTRWTTIAAVAGLCWPAAAQPSHDAIADTVQIGGVAALGPVCGLRDEAWSADLRRSTIRAATDTEARDDAALRAAPGSNLVIGALSFAEAEALETFAAAPPAATCGPLAASPLLARADTMVRAFRAAPGS